MPSWLDHLEQLAQLCGCIPACASYYTKIDPSPFLSRILFRYFKCVGEIVVRSNTLELWRSGVTSEDNEETVFFCALAELNHHAVGIKSVRVEEYISVRLNGFTMWVKPALTFV